MAKATEVQAEVEETDAPTTISATMLAERCNTTPKEFRRWLRSTTPQRAEKGGRWAFTPEAADQLEADFLARAAAKVTLVEVELEVDA